MVESSSSAEIHLLIISNEPQIAMKLDYIDSPKSLNIAYAFEAVEMGIIKEKAIEFHALTFVKN